MAVRDLESGRCMLAERTRGGDFSCVVSVASLSEERVLLRGGGSWGVMSAYSWPVVGVVVVVGVAG